MLAASFVFAGLAALLWMLGGVGQLFAVILVTFSVMGGVQAIGIARGRGETDDDRRR